MDKGFKYWFDNVFWYHYKGHLFAGIALIAVIAYAVYSMANRHDPDFMFALASQNPVHSMQTEIITARFEEWGYDAPGTALFLNENNPEVMIAWQLLMITMVDDDYAVFFVGESALDSFTDQIEGFLPMSEAGFPPAGIDPRMTEVPAEITDGIGLGPETYYALIKRPKTDGDGSVKPEDAEKTNKAKESLARLLGY
ncbi:MAG: hypothetical protein LBS19_03490 [Clostridiales bacterium]|nr:hypothetical protein [Clostridiales bacterium]